MYTWEVIMTNGNSYVVEAKQNNVEDFILKTFGDSLGSTSFGALKLKDFQDRYVLVNLNQLSEVLWKTSQ